MSVHNVALPDEWIRATLGNAACMCFRCGEDIEDVAVAWHGCPQGDAAEPMIFLHPECAQQLAIRLIRDGFEAERLMNGKPPMGGIDKSLIHEGEA